jgi:histidinol phosphatase-like PHP family hydrolase
MKPIIAALKRTGTAVEIDSAYKIPAMPFLKMAKDARLKFSFGSNTGTTSSGGIDFCVQTAQALGLHATDLFTPVSRQQKPIYRRKIVA